MKVSAQPFNTIKHDWYLLDHGYGYCLRCGTETPDSYCVKDELPTEQSPEHAEHSASTCT